MTIFFKPDFHIAQITTDQILRWPQVQQNAFSVELWHMMRAGFPRMPENDLTVCVNYALKRTSPGFERIVFCVRDAEARLCGVLIFDQGIVAYQMRSMLGIYVLLRVVIPEHQGTGLGNLLISTLLQAHAPQILLTTCAQSATLHSWKRLIEKGVVTGFDLYPRIDHTDDGHERVVTVPPEHIAEVISVFQQLYLGAVDGDQQLVVQAVQTLSEGTVRKAIYGPSYDFHPWHKDGRTDQIASALGVTEHDGILLVLRKNMSGVPLASGNISKDVLV